MYTNHSFSLAFVSGSQNKRNALHESVNHEFVCAICFEPLQKNSAAIAPPFHLTNACAGLTFCKTCARTFIATKIREQSFASQAIVCPSHYCSEALLPEDVRRVIIETTDYEVLNSSVKWWTSTESLLETFNSNHSISIAHRERRSPRFQFITNLKNDIEFGVWSMSADIRRCPGNYARQKIKSSSFVFSLIVWHSSILPGCSFLIEKNGGCNHMTCSRCRFELHWCEVCY